MSDQEIKYVHLCSEAPKGSGVVYRGAVVPKKNGEEWVRTNSLDYRNIKFWVEEVGAGTTPGNEFFQLECGTWVWWPDATRGAFYAENLRQIADELEKLNMKTQTEELQKELEKAELDKIRAIDRVKDLKAKIAEAEKGPSIFDLMPIGSVWCGWEVERHDKASFCQPIGLKCVINDYRQWPTMPSLHKLIAEQKNIDAMKRAADAAIYFCENNPNALAWLRSEVEEYKKIIEKEGE